MNTIELYVNNKVFFPSVSNDKIFISNTIMEQVTEEDLNYFLKRYKVSHSDEMILINNKDSFIINSWMVDKISTEGIEIRIGLKQLKN